MVGRVLGYVIAQAVLSIAYPYTVADYLGVSFWGHIKGAIRPILFTILLCAGASYLSTIWFTTSWIGFVLFGTVTLLATILIIFTFGLSIAHIEHYRRCVLESC